MMSLKGVAIMNYLSVQQIAEKWNISDRRVRVLCNQGRIPGVIKEGRSFKIPKDAARPFDGRRKQSQPFGKAVRFIKWDDAVIGSIDDVNKVSFHHPHYNEVVSMYTKGAGRWSQEQLSEFLSERLVSRDRRDIERILFRLGLSHYDVFKISEFTRAMHPKDLLWIAEGKDEAMGKVMTCVFNSIFNQRIDLTGESLDTPEGHNIKRYGSYEGQYGIFKQRLSPLATDVESEVAVYLLAQRLGVACCPAYRTGKDTVFSTFMFDFSREYLVHFRRLFDGARAQNEYQNLVTVRPEFKDDIARMILLDFVTRQDDRHLSNMALKVSGQKETFYPLYDNGRSLFYEDTKEMVAEAVSDPALFATSFGYTGTYWDYVQDIARERSGLSGLLNPYPTKDEIAQILTMAQIEDYRFEGALEWIVKTLEMLKELE